jgi:hypothetical protein
LRLATRTKLHKTKKNELANPNHAGRSLNKMFIRHCGRLKPNMRWKRILAHVPRRIVEIYNIAFPNQQQDAETVA